MTRSNHRWARSSFMLAAAASIIATTPPRLSAQNEIRFDGHSIVRAVADNETELTTALRLSADVWSHGVAVGRPIDLQIPAGRLAELTEGGVQSEVLIENVQALIDAERARIAGHERNGNLDGDWFDEYKSYEEVDAYLDQLVALRPDLASHFEVGRTHEGRAIYGLRITGPTGGAKPGILINACQHAREWISVMVAMYAADSLIRNYDTDPRLQNLVDTHEFIIIPIVNPDGYVYTWTTNRLWRKNRRDNGGGAFGVDLNRNWPYEWGGVGSSGSPTSDLYRGPFALSEPETTAVAELIIDEPTITKHIDFHSYSQYILHPWAFTPDNSPHHATFTDLSTSMEGAIESVHGVNYIPGRWYVVLYPSSGVMIDWLYAERNAYSFTIELRDTGQFGFILPPEQIIPTSEEAFEGLLALADAEATADMLLDVSALTRGERAGLRASHSTPGERVYFAFSLAGKGQTPVPPLNVTLDLASPRLAGAATASERGVALLTDTVPANAPRDLIWLQAAEQGRVSNVVVTQIN